MTSTADDPGLEDTVRGLQVLVPRIVARAKRRTVPAELAGHDLAPRHLTLFATLLDGPLTVNELAAALRLAPTTVSLMVTDLADQGLLTREEDPSDRRRRLVSIPARHRPAVHAWLGDSAEAWRAALSSLTPAERGLVLRTLQDYERHLADG